MVGLIPFILLSIVAVTIAVATFLAPLPWGGVGGGLFIALWALTAISGCHLLLKRKIWRRPPVTLLHVSLLLILLGALTTHLTSHQGMTHLREGQATRTCWMKDEQGAYTLSRNMPFYLALSDFTVTYDADSITPADYISHVVIATTDGEQPTTISMNNPGRVLGYRIYQTSFDDDLRGSTFTISYDPWGTAITYAAYILLAISMVWISLRKKPARDNPQFSIFLFSLITFLFSLFIFHSSLFTRPLVPILRSPMLFLHVGTIMLSYILLVVSIVRRDLLRPAVFLLATGIFLGAVWANISWGTYWSWDPKEAWALITLIAYSLPLHQKSIPWFRSDRNYRLYSILALATLLMTYLGVNLFLGGMHSYA